MKDGEVRRAVEAAARSSYGRLLALLASRSRDIAGCEDALAEAFAAALKTWPERGIPTSPEAWLLTAARNRLINGARHGRVHDAAIVDIERHLTEGQADPSFPDERLKLLFVCTHPAIDPTMRTPLMLQTVLGLDAARIASAFLVAPTAMGQRLVRAKAKIRDAKLRFEVPDPADMAERLGTVLDAVYAAYGTGWDALAGADPDEKGLTEEAIYLGRLIVALLPDEPEAAGLLALMLYCEARRGARRDGEGRFVPLSQQDHRLWSRALIIEAEGLLTRVARLGRFGRYQCEAAIQSIHVQRPLTGRINHDALHTLYDLLARHAPSTGVLVARAAVLMEAGEPEAGLAALDELPHPGVTDYQPYWTVRGHLLRALGREDEAGAAFLTAAGLTQDSAVRSYLLSAAATKR